MSEEEIVDAVDEVVEETTAEETAPEQEETGEPEAEGTTDQGEVEEQNTEAAKTFTQEELDAAVGKRLARERRKLEREYSEKGNAPSVPPVDVSDLKPEFFATPEEYTDAIAERKAEQIVAAREAQRAQKELSGAYLDKEEDARDRYVDYDQVALDPALRVSDLMADAIRSADIGPDILYHLGKNPKEAEKIANMPPLAQAMAIGRLEASLSAPKPKRTSSAPAPITPIGGNKGKVSKDPGKMDDVEYAEWRAQRKKQYGA